MIDAESIPKWTVEASSAVPQLIQLSGEIYVGLHFERLNIHRSGALIEWPAGRKEHFCHLRSLRTRKNEVHVVASLNMRAQQGLCRLFRIGGDCLKFINGDDASPVGIFRIIEYFFKCRLRLMQVAD